jgi:hypothetical protein
MNNLAGVLSDQRKYEQAEEMRRQALRLWETVLQDCIHRPFWIDYLCVGFVVGV